MKWHLPACPVTQLCKQNPGNPDLAGKKLLSNTFPPVLSQMLCQYTDAAKLLHLILHFILFQILAGHV